MILHLVTDRRRLSDGTGAAARECLLQQIEFAVAAGVDVVQIRERDLEAGELAALVRAAVDRARHSPTRILVNDRTDVALACGAAGVHLRSDSAPAPLVRAIAPPGFLIGRSVHSLAEAREAGAAVDYLIAGTVWPTPSKPEHHPLLGLEGFAALAAAVGVPVLAIGGVSIDRAAALAAAGAAGVAGIGLFLDSGAVGCRSVQLQETVTAFRRIV